MDELRQRLEKQYNAYLNSSTPQGRLLNKPPAKEDVDRMKELARTTPQRLNPISQSIYERNRNWVNFVLVRYLEQMKTFEETGYRHRLYTPEMLGRAPAAADAGGALSPAQEAQRRINRKLHGIKEGEEIPAEALGGGHAPMGATAPQQAGAPATAAAPAGAAPEGPRRVQRKVIIKRIIKKKADGTQEVVEQRTVVEVPLDAPETVRPASVAAAVPVARPAPKPAPAKPVDKELDDFFKKYNLK